jgi:transposase
MVVTKDTFNEAMFFVMTFNVNSIHKTKYYLEYTLTSYPRKTSIYYILEGYQAKIFKIGGPILIPHIHNLLNLEVKQGFPKP